MTMDFELTSMLTESLKGIEKAIKDAKVSYEKNELILGAMTQELINENKELNKQVTELAKEMKSEKNVDRNNKEDR